MPDRLPDERASQTSRSGCHPERSKAESRDPVAERKLLQRDSSTSLGMTDDVKITKIAQGVAAKTARPKSFRPILGGQ
jgi:hypothetical protein